MFFLSKRFSNAATPSHPSLCLINRFYSVTYAGPNDNLVFYQYHLTQFLNKFMRKTGLTERHHGFRRHRDRPVIVQGSGLIHAVHERLGERADASGCHRATSSACCSWPRTAAGSPWFRRCLARRGSGLPVAHAFGCVAGLSTPGRAAGDGPRRATQSARVVALARGGRAGNRGCAVRPTRGARALPGGRGAPRRRPGGGTRGRSQGRVTPSSSTRLDGPPLPRHRLPDQTRCTTLRR